MFGTEREKMLVRSVKMEKSELGDRMKILEERIEEERRKLNYAIEKNEDYDVIYELSIGVDKLLEEYIKKRTK